MKLVSDVLRDLLFICCIVLAGVLWASAYKHYKTSARASALKDRISDYGGMIVPIRISKDQDKFFTIGTGELIMLPSKQTAILTNSHVCEAALATSLWVSTVVHDRPVYDLKIMKNSLIPDLCLYYSPSVLYMRSFLVKDIAPTYGELLLEIGFPLNGRQRPTTGFYLGENKESKIGMPLLDSNGCTHGEVDPEGYCVLTEDLEATTVETYPGNSGSPVFNEQGAMIGIMNSADGETHDGQFVSGKHILEFIKGL